MIALSTLMVLLAMNTILFYSVSDEYGEFSNFSNHSIFIDGTTWPSVEHYFQANKFKDGAIRFSIQMAKSPHEAARLGRSREFPLREDWEGIKDDVMRKAVMAKFVQHEKLRDMLLSTGDAVIVEHTANDSYWGDGGDGSGKNMLGRILMDTRSILRGSQNADPLKNPKLPPWEKYPGLASTDFKWAMGEGESYLIEWTEWFSSLSAEEKRRYMSEYPEPEGWEGFYMR